MKLRIGLIGLGRSWETRHAPILRSMSDRFDVRAVCEQISHRAERVANEFEADCVDGFHALSRREDIDAVLLLARQWYGALPILAACKAGKAIYCAAALDLAVDEACQLKQRVEQSGVAFMAELPRRHAPATLRLKELIATHLGPPKMIFCHERISTEPDPSDTTLGRRPSVLRHTLLELVDWCRYVVGREPTSVNGLAHGDASEVSRNELDRVDYEMMSLHFAADEPTAGEDQADKHPTVAQISCGRYIPADWPEAITFRPPAAMQVRCENGIAFIDLPSTLIWFDTAGRHLESLENERPVGEQLLDRFHRAVTSLVRRTSDLEDAYQALNIVNAARRSGEQGTRIELA